MKILNIHTTITADQLFKLLQQKLNPLFQQQTQSDISFDTEIKDGKVEIFHQSLYEGFLFSIEIEGQELWITRSEHYVDDVNSLTIESILNELFTKIASNGKVTLILEG